MHMCMYIHLCGETDAVLLVFSPRRQDHWTDALHAKVPFADFGWSLP